MEITINKKTYKITEITDDLQKIAKIINNNCSYCKAKNYKTDTDKIKLIKKIIDKYDLEGCNNDRTRQ